MDTLEVRQICGRWNYLHTPDLTDADKELFALAIAAQIMRGVPASLSMLSSLFHYLNAEWFEGTYELANNPLPTDEQVAEIEATLARTAGQTWKLAWRSASTGVPVYERLKEEHEQPNND